MTTPEGNQAKKKKADLKVVIIGDAAVGKTCLVHRYLNGEFPEGSPNTIGAAFFLKQWGAYNIAIWDTAGEEKFSGLSGFYCRGANAAIVAYDIRDKKTFESIDARYTTLLETAADNCAIVLAGTKKDLVKESNRDITRDIGIEKVDQLRKHWNSKMHPSGKEPYFETSALTGENVKEVFEYVFETLVPDLSSAKVETGKDTVDMGQNVAAKEHKCGCLLI
eukprot:Seg3789.2 transcript_id=Seg3789.2/GoldUCD/mRNA.D3Y31 product="Ras-related protein Rab-20" protein_id=Seg3789.2/GoldUCD/D3Y31